MALDRKENALNQSVLVYIGLGSNLNNPVAQITRALESLDSIEETSFVASSSLYVGPAMGGGPTDQADYVNAVAVLRSALSPRHLLHELQMLERLQGRKKGARWGPRSIDLDMLLYGDVVIDEIDFRLPHIGLHQRSFVLIPLHDVAPDLVVPIYGKLSCLVDALDVDQLQLVSI
jgi:2-amino-4-hydroxy-6-hydroxymethyldihydropteridine diphosphokinase